LFISILWILCWNTMDILYGFSGAIANFIAWISHFPPSELCFTSLSKRLRIMKFTILVPTRFLFFARVCSENKSNFGSTSSCFNCYWQKNKNRHVDLVDLSDCIVIKNINTDKNNRASPLCLGFSESLSPVLDRHIIHTKKHIMIIVKAHWY
jgi:hypothetical protein